MEMMGWGMDNGEGVGEKEEGGEGEREGERGR